MNIIYKIILIILVLIVLSFILNSFGAITTGSSLNDPLNRLIAGTPDKSCNVDSDCVIKSTRCSPCDCGDAVNQRWYTYCPFPIAKIGIFCKPCATPGQDFDLKCVNNQCQKVWKN